MTSDVKESRGYAFLDEPDQALHGLVLNSDIGMLPSTQFKVAGKLCKTVRPVGSCVGEEPQKCNVTFRLSCC